MLAHVLAQALELVLCNVFQKNMQLMSAMLIQLHWCCQRLPAHDQARLQQTAPGWELCCHRVHTSVCNTCCRHDLHARTHSMNDQDLSNLALPQLSTAGYLSDTLERLCVRGNCDVLACAGCLVGEDAANQALQADINANPAIRLTAASLHQDASGWLGRALAATSAQRVESQHAQQAESAHDQLVEVEDAGLEGGQEGCLVPGEQASVPEDPSGSGDQAANDVKHEPREGQDLKRQNSPTELQDTPSRATAQQHVSHASAEQGAPNSPVRSRARLNSPEQHQVEPEGLLPASDALQDTDMSDADPLQLVELPNQEQTRSGPEHARQTASPPAGLPKGNGSFILMTRENGWLELYALPGMELVFSHQHASAGPAVLADGGCSPDPSSLEGVPQMQTMEVSLQSFGPSTMSGTLAACSHHFSMKSGAAAWKLCTSNCFDHIMQGASAQQHPTGPQCVTHYCAMQPARTADEDWIGTSAICTQ